MIKQPTTERGAAKRLRLFEILIKAGIAIPEKINKLLPSAEAFAFQTIENLYEVGGVQSAPRLRIREAITGEEILYDPQEQISDYPFNFSANRSMGACPVVIVDCFDGWALDTALSTIYLFDWMIKAEYSNKEQVSATGGNPELIINNDRKIPFPTPLDYLTTGPHYLDYYACGRAQLTLPYPYPRVIPYWLDEEIENEITHKPINN